MAYISANSKKSIFIPYVIEHKITTILASIKIKHDNSGPG